MALENLTKSYEQWRNAANLSWLEYLIKVKAKDSYGAESA
jgi:hypothetical protein